MSETVKIKVRDLKVGDIVEDGYLTGGSFMLERLPVERIEDDGNGKTAKVYFKGASAVASWNYDQEFTYIGVETDHHSTPTPVAKKTRQKNIITQTDSYKFTHWKQYHPDTEGVYSYLEARKGAKFPYTVFFGLQRILQDHLVGQVVNSSTIQKAQALSEIHFGSKDVFNTEGWTYISTELDGKLPLRIKAVPEGTKVPVGNVLMTIENTDPKCAWLTNYVESLLMHVWYPTTVATLSKYTIDDIISPYWEATADDLGGLDFVLHDFGYRGGPSEEASAIGGMAHLINSKGTDNVPALEMAHDYYDAPYETLGFSVPATEHSVMTSEGPMRELKIVERIIDNNPKGIVSVVADSYNIYDFVKNIGKDYLKTKILERDGTFVVRPDSTTDEHPKPEDLVEWILNQLWEDFGGSLNKKSFRVLDPHIRVLWGDGLEPEEIGKILNHMVIANFSAENIVFGMGGGLIQKVNRDTMRFAIKASSITRDGEQFDVCKNPLDSTKASKKGRLRLIQISDEVGDTQYHTIKLDDKFAWAAIAYPDDKRKILNNDILETVFENGELVNSYTFDEVRANALRI